MGSVLRSTAILAGVVAAGIVSGPMIRLLVCSGFFEEGCGVNENSGLVLALLGSAAIGIFSCWLTHRLIAALLSRGADQ